MTLATVIATVLIFVTVPVQVQAEDDGEFVPNEPNPYCDKVKSGESEDTGVCHDRYDYEYGDFASCNDGSQREDPEDCPDATEDD